MINDFCYVWIILGPTMKALVYCLVCLVVTGKST